MRPSHGQAPGAGCERLEALLGVGKPIELPGGQRLPGRAALRELRTGVEVEMLSYVAGCDAMKPLDCVGTAEEARLALCLAEERRRRRRLGGGAAAGEAGSGGVRGHCGRCDQGLPRFFRSAAWATARRRGGAAAAGGEDASGGDPAEAGLLDAFNDEHLMPAWFESTARRLWDERGKY
jgi:hypothetical protein